MTCCREEWRDIPGYEGLYKVSSSGRLVSYKRGELRPFKSRDGYLVATLQKNGQRYRTGVHRLVAAAFIPNPDNKPQINHMNGDKTDNRVENLERATSSENNLHRRRVLQGGGGRPKRPVCCIDTGVVYGSITEASADTGAPIPQIVSCCKGRRKHTGGYAWEYAEVGT